MGLALPSRGLFRAERVEELLGHVDFPDLTVTMVFDVDLGYPARTHGDPYGCYPADGPNAELVEHDFEERLEAFCFELKCRLRTAFDERVEHHKENADEMMEV